jgi:hypothetical protein
MILGPDGQAIAIEPAPFAIEPDNFEKHAIVFAARSLGFEGPKNCDHGIWYCETCAWEAGYPSEWLQRSRRR